MKIRWFWLGLWLLLGLALLWQGLFWLDQYVYRVGRGKPPAPPVEAGQTNEQAASTPMPATERLSPPSSLEIDTLSSANPYDRLDVARRLRERSVTPQLMVAVDAALASSPPPDLEAELRCLKSRFPGRETLDFILERLPDEESFDRNEVEVAGCFVAALADRTESDRGIVYGVLLRYAFHRFEEVRGEALRGLSRIEVSELPPLVLSKWRSRHSEDRRRALDAALALGALRHSPGFIEAALGDRGSDWKAQKVLETDPSPEAGRIVARAYLKNPGTHSIKVLFRNRESWHLDVTPALVEVALDEKEAEPTRRSALEALQAYGDTGALPLLAPLADSPSESIRRAAGATLAELERKLRLGRKPRMKALPSRK